ncbi:uncharacterized protein LOC132609051 [Lycium barbarum]|uniref:uncharacterized protein LOC132609051 n=1 Tax=Lycium barbarum TaxID=112863 RepID=UPI00293E04F8|nr:uncharacterized protein LOC132609051 [Lycium barbarum]
MIPSFEKTLTKSYVRNDDFILPNSISEELPDYECEAIVVFHPRAFRMTFKIGAYRRLYKGWKHFIDTMDLKEGDTLCFQICETNTGVGFIVEKKPEIVDVD